MTPGTRVKVKNQPTQVGSEWAGIKGRVVEPHAVNRGWTVIHTDDGQRLQMPDDDLTTRNVDGPRVTGLSIDERTLIYELLTDRYEEAMADTDSDFARSIDTLRRRIAPAG